MWRGVGISMSWLKRWFLLTNDVETIWVKKRILSSVLLLVSIGIVMVYSSSFPYAKKVYGDPMFFFWRHLFFTGIGIIFMVIGFKIRSYAWRRVVKYLVIFCIVLLGLVLIPSIGRVAGGARRWISFLGLNFQPSELMLFVLVMYTADFISRKVEENMSWLENPFSYFPVYIVFGISSLLILLEPDLGTVVLAGIVISCMLWCSGISLRYVLGVGLVAVVSFWKLVLCVPYRCRRVMAFLNPWADPKDAGFQLVQSQIALGSGGILGRGLGCGLQKLFYLPAGHTDFIFAVIGEELGLVGTLFIVGLYLYLFVNGFILVMRQKDVFVRFVLIGILVLLMSKTTINLAVNVGLLPPKGLPLPFLSYGGTAQVMNFFMIGVLLGIGE